jgi:hypothetical protein
MNSYNNSEAPQTKPLQNAGIGNLANTVGMNRTSSHPHSQS